MGELEKKIGSEIQAPSQRLTDFINRWIMLCRCIPFLRVFEAYPFGPGFCMFAPTVPEYLVKQT
jgi:hypothetical protein